MVRLVIFNFWVGFCFLLPKGAFGSECESLGLEIRICSCIWKFSCLVCKSMGGDFGQNSNFWVSRNLQERGFGSDYPKRLLRPTDPWGPPVMVFPTVDSKNRGCGGNPSHYRFWPESKCTWHVGFNFCGSPKPQRDPLLPLSPVWFCLQLKIQKNSSHQIELISPTFIFLLVPKFILLEWSKHLVCSCRSPVRASIRTYLIHSAL